MAAPDRMDERLRALGLVEGQRMAQALFAEVAARGLIAPGRSEREVSDRIGALTREVPAWGTCGSWRAVRSGPHSALPAGQEPPEDRILTGDDIAIADLGPVLAGYESGFVRTVVIGQDPDKRRLIEDLPRLFAAAREAFHADRTLTGSHLHAEIQTLATKAGWTLGGWNAGHMVGAPNAHGGAQSSDAYISPANDRPLRRTAEDGWQAHWLLEISLLDEHRGFGGAYKGLLDLA
ncbi:M24 family metallopeptidase [Streptomyces sp. NBC_01445]|uniref:M24 family metallopeptidase n=2 Tax=unclassified Streptomyces TaxID=2593676 RepID=UPI002DD96AEA|nr:M24 family metallopeptidase [Streptomyces sp. NBC_01445]WSE04372.1 aminopeptidase P family protein [Streptomyces sp. NBC_01445]